MRDLQLRTILGFQFRPTKYGWFEELPRPRVCFVIRLKANS